MGHESNRVRQGIHPVVHRSGDQPSTAGGEHLFGYDYYGGDVVLSTPEGLTVGSTLSDARSMYPTIDIDESPRDPTDGVWAVDDDPIDDSQLSGYSTVRVDADLVTSILGGITCGE